MRRALLRAGGRRLHVDRHQGGIQVPSHRLLHLIGDRMRARRRERGVHVDHQVDGGASTDGARPDLGQRLDARNGGGDAAHGGRIDGDAVDEDGNDPPEQAEREVARGPPEPQEVTIGRARSTPEAS